MDLRRLRYFVATVEAGSVSRAAEKLHVVQSAMSTQIRKLEESLGTQLLVRSAHGVQPTASGTRLLRHARTILESVARAEHEMREPEGAGRPVRIGIPSSISRMLTVPLLRAVEDELPGVTLQVVEAMTAELEALLAQNELDLALPLVIGTPPGSQGWSPLRSERLYLVSPVEAAPPPEPLPFAALADFDLALPTMRHRVRQAVSHEAARHGIALRIKHELDSLPQTMQLIQHGGCRSVMIISSFIEDWRAGRAHARPVEGVETPARLMLATAPDTGGEAIEPIRALIAAAVARLARDEAWPDSLPARLETPRPG